MKKIIMVVPDRTRKAHVREVLLPVLRDLNKQRVEILIGLGLHEPLDREQIIELLGEDIAANYVIRNQSQQPQDLLYFGKTKRNVPIYLNKHLKEAERIITFGVVEPHLYAGYSGGVKTVAIGLAGDKTISFTHHPRFLDQHGTALANIKNNPFQDTLWEITAGLPIDYCVNVVNDAQGALKKVFAGKPREVFLEAVKYADKLYRHAVKKPFDALVAEIDGNKGANIYQASRAYNYVLGVPHPVVRENGFVVVQADIPDGFGRGIGERRFAQILKTVKQPDNFIQKIKKGGCQAGEHRAYMVAKALQKARLIFVSPDAPQLLRGTPLQGFSALQEAMTYMKQELGYLPKTFVTKEVFNAIYTLNMVK